ncbi:helix-turn-helix domain-containing protein [Streptomyces sp. NPDC046977]|uniref:helix-turn-helix transcriptional regulator n=1 Tax=Streptomyces sp. NPDC046977 TaxID=3154703 RepID=UPI0033CFA0C6
MAKKVVRDETAQPLSDELLSPRQVHGAYGFSPQTLANWRWSGQGPDYIKTGSTRSARIRYKRTAIEAWLQARTVTVGGRAA